MVWVGGKKNCLFVFVTESQGNKRCRDSSAAVPSLCRRCRLGSDPLQGPCCLWGRAQGRPCGAGGEHGCGEPGVLLGLLLLLPSLVQRCVTPVPAVLAPVLSLAGTAPRALLGFMLLGSRVKIGLGGGGGRGGADFRKDKQTLFCFQTRQCPRLAPAGGQGLCPGAGWRLGWARVGAAGCGVGAGQRQGAVSGGGSVGPRSPWVPGGSGAGAAAGRWEVRVPGGAGSGAGCGVAPRAPARAARGRGGAVGVSSPEVRRRRSPPRPVT